MPLSRNEEIIHRELGALAGDLQQVAENITRDHKERVKQSDHDPPGGLPMLFDRRALTADLSFIEQRLDWLLDYIKTE